MRFANVYGPNSEHKKGVVNKFVQRILADEPLTIFGNGESTRDYIHVDDLCAGIELALTKEGLHKEVIHLATGRETSLKELATIFFKVAGRDESILFEPERVGEVEKNFALYDYANQLLGFEPRVDLEQGIKETFDYLKKCYGK